MERVGLTGGFEPRAVTTYLFLASLDDAPVGVGPQEPFQQVKDDKLVPKRVDHHGASANCNVEWLLYNSSAGIPKESDGGVRVVDQEVAFG